MLLGIQLLQVFLLEMEFLFPQSGLCGKNIQKTESKILIGTATQTTFTILAHPDF